MHTILHILIAEVVRVASKYFAPPPQVKFDSPQTDRTFKIQNNHNNINYSQFGEMRLPKYFIPAFRILLQKVQHKAPAHFS